MEKGDQQIPIIRIPHPPYLTQIKIRKCDVKRNIAIQKNQGNQR